MAVLPMRIPLAAAVVMRARTHLVETLGVETPILSGELAPTQAVAPTRLVEAAEMLILLAGPPIPPNRQIRLLTHSKEHVARYKQARSASDYSPRTER